MLDLWPFELDEDDGLFGAEEVGHDAEDLEVKLFDLVAGKDGVGVPLHPGVDLVERKDVCRGGGLSANRKG